jgi:hypothetical protein
LKKLEKYKSDSYINMGQPGLALGAIKWSGHSGCQAIQDAKDKGERNFFFPIWLPNYLIFFKSIFSWLV